MNRLALALALAMSLASVAEAKVTKTPVANATASTHAAARSAVDATKSINVKGYRTKSGKWVAPHARTVKVRQTPVATGSR